MYNDTKLRQRLSELGLPTHGNKALLSARHKEWVNLHNANIDSKYPRSRQELLIELQRWDITQQHIMNSTRGDKRRLDGEDWERKCKDEFTELARRARESAKRKKVGDTLDEGMEKEGSTGEAGVPGQTSEMDGTVQSYGDERVISSQRSNQETVA